MISDVIDKPRLLWACRRGMLELDLLFTPFVNEAFDLLVDQDKLLFQRLLACEDPELFSWFMGHKECADPDLARMIDVIRQRLKV